jgi:hypothetical protein
MYALSALPTSKPSAISLRHGATRQTSAVSPYCTATVWKEETLDVVYPISKELSVLVTLVLPENLPILRGGGCIAYRYKPGQSVYGWGVSRQRSPAQNRAADECSKRNANQECDAHAWACNSTTKAKLVVELEKDMSPVLRAAADGVACNFIVHTNCQIPGRKLQTMFAYESFRTGKKLKFPGFSNCKEARKTGKIIYREIGGKPIIGMEQVF